MARRVRFAPESGTTRLEAFRDAPAQRFVSARGDREFAGRLPAAGLAPPEAVDGLR